MKEILKVVLTKKYLLYATLIIFATLILMYICRHHIYRFLFAIMYGVWGLKFIYVKLSID